MKFVDPSHMILDSVLWDQSARAWSWPPALRSSWDSDCI